MTNRLLISVAAAALFAGTGLANAQGTGMSKDQPSSGSSATTQHSAPSGGASSDRGSMKGTENSTKGELSSIKGAQSEKGQPGASGKNAQDTAQDQKSKSTEHSTKGESSSMKGAELEKGQPGASGKSAQDTAPGQKSKSTEHETKGSKDMKAEERDKSGSTAAESRDKSGGTDAQKGATDTSRSQTTTGAATAGPPAEKRTQITSAIKSEKIEEATNVNVNLSVGATVPSTVRLHPLPPKIVEIYPEWRGYEVILVKGRYIIVKPETHEVVYIIEG